MAELPSSWGLRTVPNAKGTLDVIGKDDLGNDYKVRRTDQAGITERDVQELAAADREQTTAREFIDGLKKHSKAIRRSQENSFEDELFELAKPVVAAGLHNSAFGSTAAYRRGFEEVFGA